MDELQPRLAAWLAWRSLTRQPMIAAATVLGVAIGMSVVGAILIVDHNSVRAGRRVNSAMDLPPDERANAQAFEVRFERRRGVPEPSVVPTQEGTQDTASRSPDRPAGEEDYQAMRLAVRLGSLLAFGVGAVIVFYTLRFSVVVRTRETSLLRCLGESRSNVALSLLLQAAGFGGVGTLTGLILAVPFGLGLLGLGISTTGRNPLSGWRVDLPFLELGAMALISVSVSLLGVVGPVRSLLRQDIAESLNPRFLSSEVDERSFRSGGAGWVVPPLLAATYLAFRPFLRDWVSVVEFFLLEVAAVVALALVTLYLVPAFLRAALRPFERLLLPLMPLEALLVGRRMRLTSQSLVFTVGCVALAFSLLTGLHDVTGALKTEIADWGDDVMLPYAFYKPRPEASANPPAVEALLDREELERVRLSHKLRGAFPIRLVHSEDVNPARIAEGRPPLAPGRMVLSETLAARSSVGVGDVVVIEANGDTHRFEIIEVADQLGFFAESTSYVDLKLYAVASEGNPVFAGNLEATLGDRVRVHRRDLRTGGPLRDQRKALEPYFDYVTAGARERFGRLREIDRDFLIFDFILAMTVLLAAIGVGNNMLIQVHSRRRELLVLRTVGVDRRQTVKLVVLEGLFIGLVGAALALVLGHVIGVISVAFLDQFTLFRYRFVWSTTSSVVIAALAAVTCAAAAVYPAWVAPRISSAESLHYE